MRKYCINKDSDRGDSTQYSNIPDSTAPETKLRAKALGFTKL
jgi:hypothetical protein